MFFFRFFLIVFGLAALGVQNNAQEIEKDMVRFDEAFIPVWVHAKTGNIVAAKKSGFLSGIQMAAIS